jgi:hypothetical protein
MTLHGTAFITMWHGIQSGHENEYLAWHTREHMPERLGVPGFLRGRRFVDWSIKPHQTFTLYESAHIETFRSPGYMARLNAPTEWSNRVQPSMRDFLRAACETVLSLGDGVGGAIMPIRLKCPSHAHGGFESELMAKTVGFSRCEGVCALHLGKHVPEIAMAPTAESRLRPPQAGADFDYLLLIEGVALDAMQAVRAAIEKDLSTLGIICEGGATYPLSYALQAPR